MKVFFIPIILIGLALFATPAAAAPAPAPGTIILTNPPAQYGQVATFEYHVTRRYRLMIGAVLCWQRPVYQLADYSLIAETGWLDPHSNDGTFSIRIANGDGNALPHPLDYSQPADCLAYVFREPQSGNQSGAILTNLLQFRVEP